MSNTEAERKQNDQKQRGNIPTSRNYETTIFFPLLLFLTLCDFQNNPIYQTVIGKGRGVTFISGCMASYTHCDTLLSRNKVSGIERLLNYIETHKAEEGNGDLPWTVEINIWFKDK